MKQLFKVLPPFAPDYSGVCSVLFSLNGMIIVHDAGGCTGNITGYDEPRWYGSNAAIFSSGLREIEAVLGDDERLIVRIIRAAERLDRRFIALLGSPAPAVMGTDLEALACILEKRSGLPVLSFNTTGMNYYDRGASEAYLQIARRFVEPCLKKQPMVNVLGATPLDMGQAGSVEGIVAILRECGFQKVLVWGHNAGLPEIKGAGNAVLNVVVAYSGLQAARFLEKDYSIPYITGIPVGHSFTREFKHQAILHSRWQVSNEMKSFAKLAPQIKRALIIGEQIRANSLRACLRLDMGIEHVDIASFFAMDNELREKKDYFLEEEGDLAILSQVGNYDLVIGDPLYKDLLDGKSNRIYGALPHSAVSSHLYWHDEVDYIGQGAVKMLSRIIGGC